jgi:hydroxypyruvate reductase
VAQRVSEVVTLARAAVGACEGGALVAEALGDARASSVAATVWAVGKAARAMARDFPSAWIVDASSAGHPLPDERSVAAAEHLLMAARALPATARALLLLSGGASALVGAPVDGLTLDELRAATAALLRGGASIHESNVVRRHLTKLGGGKLAAACAGAIDVLALSDVAGDDPATIGSGPASPEPATRAEALALARKYSLPDAALRALERVGENPRAGDPVFARGSYRVLASPETLREAAARVLAADGRRVIVWPRLVAGDVEELAAELAVEGRRLPRGAAIVAVGEPTVRVRGNGVGGRAQQLALSLVAPLGSTSACFVALGSDGRDGPTDAAGAFVDGGTLGRCAARGIDVAGALARCDSNRALAAVGAAIPRFDSGTNLTDLYILVSG